MPSLLHHGPQRKCASIYSALYWKLPSVPELRRISSSWTDMFWDLVVVIGHTLQSSCYQWDCWFSHLCLSHCFHTDRSSTGFPPFKPLTGTIAIFQAVGYTGPDIFEDAVSAEDIEPCVLPKVKCFCFSRGPWSLCGWFRPDLGLGFSPDTFVHFPFGMSSRGLTPEGRQYSLCLKMYPKRLFSIKDVCNVWPLLRLSSLGGWPGKVTKRHFIVLFFEADS